MMTGPNRWVVLVLASSWLPAPARAQIVNGGFEDGLTGWSSFVSSPPQARLAVQAGAAHAGNAGLALQVVSGDYPKDGWSEAVVWQSVWMANPGPHQVGASVQVIRPGGRSAVGLRLVVDEGGADEQWYQDFAALELADRQYLGTTVWVPDGGASLKIEIFAGEAGDYAAPLATTATVDQVWISTAPVPAHPLKLHYRVAVAAGVRLEVPVDLLCLGTAVTMTPVVAVPADPAVALLDLPAAELMSYPVPRAFAVGVTGAAGAQPGAKTGATIGFEDGNGGSVFVRVDAEVIASISSPPRLIDPVRVTNAQDRYDSGVPWMVEAVEAPAVGLRAKADAVATSLPGPWINPSVGGDTQNYEGQSYYTCPTCGCSLAYEPEMPAAYTCSCDPLHPPVAATGQVNRGWAYWRYIGAAAEAETAAVMYAITGEVSYAVATHDLLVEFGRSNLRRPEVLAEAQSRWWEDAAKYPHFNALMGARLVRAYDHTREVTDGGGQPLYAVAERVLIEENLLRPLGRMEMYRYNAGAGNHQTFHNMGAFIIGAFLGDDGLKTDALEGRVGPWLAGDTLDGSEVWERRFGIAWQLENGMDDLGFWWEGSTGYQYAGVNWPMMWLAQLNPAVADLANLRVPTLHGTGSKGIRELQEALFAITYPTLGAPALNDNVGTIGTPAFFDALLGVYPESEPIRFAFDRSFNLLQPSLFFRGQTEYELYRIGNPTGMILFRELSGLFSDTPSPTNVADPRVPTLLPTGVAALRTPSTVVVFDHSGILDDDPAWWERQGWNPGSPFDGYHGHEDLLHVVFWGGGNEWLTDLGYDKPRGDFDLAWAWMEDVVGHNLVMAGDLADPLSWNQDPRSEGRSLGFSAGERLQVAVGRADDIHPAMSSYWQERWVFLLGDDLMFTWDRAHAEPARTFDRIDHLRGRFDQESPNQPGGLSGPFGYELLTHVERRPTAQTAFDLEATKADPDGASLRVVHFPQPSGHEIYTAELPYAVGRASENLRVLVHRVPLTTDLKIGVLYEAAGTGLAGGALALADAVLADDEAGVDPQLTFRRGTEEYALTWSEQDGTNAFLCVGNAEVADPSAAARLGWLESLAGRREPTACGPLAWHPTAEPPTLLVESESLVGQRWRLSVRAGGAGQLVLSPSEWTDRREVKVVVDGVARTLTRGSSGFALALTGGEHQLDAEPVPGASPPETGGCDCRSSSAPGWTAGLALLAIRWRRRRPS